MKRQNIFALILCMFMLITLFSGEANAQRDRVSRNSNVNLCEDSDTKIVVKLATSKTRYYKNYSARTINAIHSAPGGSTILGLAGGPIEITSNSRYKMRTLKGKTCVQLDKVEVLFWAKPVVVIASNFNEGSCEYREVFAHEQRHIRITRKFLKQFAPKLRKEMREIIATTRTQMVVSEGKIKKAQQALQKPINARLTAFHDKIFPVLRSRQAAVDTPEEYAKVNAKCKNWGKKLANGG